VSNLAVQISPVRNGIPAEGFQKIAVVPSISPCAGWYHGFAVDILEPAAFDLLHQFIQFFRAVNALRLHTQILQNILPDPNVIGPLGDIVIGSGSLLRNNIMLAVIIRMFQIILLIGLGNSFRHHSLYVGILVHIGIQFQDQSFGGSLPDEIS